MDEITLNFKIGVYYGSKTIQEIINIHSILVQAGDSARKIRLLTLSERGRIYKHLKTNESRPESWDDLCTVLQVCKRTADRYILLSEILDAYPRLLICDVSMEEILRLYKNLNEYLTKDEDLLFRLKAPLKSIKIAGGGIHSSGRLPGASTRLDEQPHEPDSDDGLGTDVLWRLQDELLE